MTFDHRDVDAAGGPPPEDWWTVEQAWRTAEADWETRDHPSEAAAWRRWLAERRKARDAA